MTETEDCCHIYDPRNYAHDPATVHRPLKHKQIRGNKLDNAKK